MVDFLRHSYYISKKKKVNRKGIETQKQDSKKEWIISKGQNDWHSTPNTKHLEKIWKNANLLSYRIPFPFQPSIIGKGSTYLRDDEDRQGFTISVVPTASVFIYQLWSKFHRVFNKSNGFKNGFAHGTHRSFEIEKDYKERLQKVYRHSPPVSIVASSMFRWLWFPLSPWWNSPNLQTCWNRILHSHQRNCMQARLPGSIMLWKEIIIARYCSSWSKASGSACEVSIPRLSSVKLSMKFYKQKTAFWQKATQEFLSCRFVHSPWFCNSCAHISWHKDTSKSDIELKSAIHTRLRFLPEGWDWPPSVAAQHHQFFIISPSHCFWNHTSRRKMKEYSIWC